MRALVTGAFGRLGPSITAALADAGHRVRGFDLPTDAARKRAASACPPVDTSWGDITDADAVAAAVAGQDAVIHAAGILAPASEADPERTMAVNAGGTANVLAAAAAEPVPPVVVLLSSVSVYGPVLDRPPPRRVDEEPWPTDSYTRSKVAAEELLRASPVPWVILRVGVSLHPGGTEGASWEATRRLLRTPPDNRIEWVHPDDVGQAAARAVEVSDAQGRILNIGGGESCQLRQQAFINGIFGAAGLGPLGEDAFGDQPYYTDWLDTEESQRLLHYQRHTWDDFLAESRRRLRGVRVVVRPVGGLLGRALVAVAHR